MMRRALFVAVLATIVAVPLAFAQVQDRYRVSSDPDARGYPASLGVVLVSPPDYVRSFIGRLGNDGEWKGPRYQATGKADLGGDSTLGWSAAIEKAPSTRQTIIDNLVHDWGVIREGTEPIERRVGGRDVGTLSGTWVLTQGTPMAGEARYEAGLVFPLCGRTAYIGISALLPSTDSAGGALGFGEYRIMGMAPTVWNREQVLATIRGISVEGSLPVGRITAARRGARIAGSVTDCNGHPVAGVAVRLERLVGRTWRTAARGKTRADGSYALAARGTGPFRAVAGDRRSRPIR